MLSATGYVTERGGFGVWVLGEAGAVLVRPGGRRVHCLCVRVEDRELPPADRIAHLLLALRADERGFATLANLAFSGAAWRLRRRLPAPAPGKRCARPSPAPAWPSRTDDLCTCGQCQPYLGDASCWP